MRFLGCSSLKMFDVMAEDASVTLSNDSIPWKELQGKRVLVTGATGLIGLNILETLRYLREEKGIGVSVIGLARDLNRIPGRFLARDGFDFQIGNVEKLPGIEGNVDYIIHGAGPTASRFFLQNPVETIRTAVEGTTRLLELAREKQCQGFIYLSTMEIYGYPPKGKSVTEQDISAFDPGNPRNSYPISKILCESMCLSYCAEYQVPAKVVRLTQTFGPGVRYDDGRVFAEFARCVMEERDIVLRTLGETERSYLYTADAVQAIFAVLLNGKAGECYTAANEDTYCSIADMARLVANEIAGGRIRVRFDVGDAKKLGYADTLYMKLDCKKLRSLGWQPTCSLREMYTRMAMGMDRA